MDIENKERFVEQRINAMRAMRASQRPQTYMEGTLQTIGYLQTFERGGLRFRIKKWFSTWIAKHSLGWTDTDIAQSVEIGINTAMVEKELEFYYEYASRQQPKSS